MKQNNSNKILWKVPQLAICADCYYVECRYAESTFSKNLQNLEPFGATKRHSTLSIMTLKIMALSTTTLYIIALSIITLNINALSIMTLKIMAISIMTLNINEITAMTFNKMEISIMTFNIRH
jgi:hypothetical protein